MYRSLSSSQQNYVTGNTEETRDFIDHFPNFLRFRWVLTARLGEIALTKVEKGQNQRSWSWRERVESLCVVPPSHHGNWNTRALTETYWIRNFLLLITFVNIDMNPTYWFLSTKLYHSFPILIIQILAPICYAFSSPEICKNLFDFVQWQPLLCFILYSSNEIRNFFNTHYTKGKWITFKLNWSCCSKFEQQFFKWQAWFLIPNISLNCKLSENYKAFSWFCERDV